MSDIDRRIIRQMRWLSIAVAALIILVVSNFYIAFARPNESTQTIVGPIGPQGLSIRGEKGDKGDTGKTGAPGLPGQSGSNGVNGSNGANGLDGRDGMPGKDGTNGADGLSGTNGRTPTLRCNPDNNSVEWKYEDDTTWQTLYTFTSASCSSNLRPVAQE